MLMGNSKIVLPSLHLLCSYIATKVVDDSQPVYYKYAVV